MTIYVQALDPNDSWNLDNEAYVRDVERMNLRYASALLGIPPEWKAEQDSKRQAKAVAQEEDKAKAEAAKADRYKQACAWFSDMLTHPNDILPGMDLVAPGPDHFVFRVPKNFTSEYVEWVKVNRPLIYEEYMARFE